MMKDTIKVKGMHCGSCEMLIQDALEDKDVKSKLSHEKGTAEVEFDEKKISLDEIKKAIKEEGFEIEES